MESKTKERLKKKLKNKNNVPEEPPETNLIDMLDKVQKMLKNNPQMVSKMNTMVSSLFDSQLSQIFETKPEVDSPANTSGDVVKQ
jgi:hypothetical protein